jgi:hypothetical protein
MDKYRPAPETHADIISENLWSYLANAYGVMGHAYSEGKKKKKMGFSDTNPPIHV